MFSEEIDQVRETPPVLGDEFLARTGSARYAVPELAPARDIDTIRPATVEWGALASTETWMYAGHANTVFHRYLLSDKGVTHNANGLAATMESARQALPIPNARWGLAIDRDHFYMGYRSSGSSVFRVRIVDEDATRGIAADGSR